MSSVNSLVTTSADKTARMWTLNPESGSYSPTVLSDQTADVTAVAVHASRNYFVTASLDRSWCFYDGDSATCLQKVRCCE